MGAVSGTVYDSTGAPVNGRIVRVHRRDTGALIGEVETGATGAGEIIFTYEGEMVEWTVPPGVYELEETKLWGGGGGGANNGGGLKGGGAGFVSGKLAVTPGEILRFYVAQGGKGTSNGRAGGNGGGSSAIVRGTTVLAEAGGGGGGAYYRGGAGGGDDGQSAETGSGTVTPAGGGSQSTPGVAGVGSQRTGNAGSGHDGGDGHTDDAGVYTAAKAFGHGLGGRGGTSGSDGGGGGGGGGYKGGGGGGRFSAGLPGGGGSGYDGGLTESVNEAGDYETPGGASDPDRAGAGAGGAGSADGANGRIVIRYSFSNDAGTYSIDTGAYTDEVQVVCLDDDAGTLQNDLIHRTYPV